MASGFETVVRTVVFPNIRPAPARSLPPQDDPTKGFAVIKGNGAKALTLSDSFSMSMSKSHQVETERRVDEVRVYQQDDDGTVNKDNFVDLQVANRITMRGGKQPAVDGGGPGFGGTAEEEAGAREELKKYYYRLVQEDLNIEIRKRNYILPSGKETGPI
jgi:hypothetical protein